MQPEERYEGILKILDKQETVTLSQIVETFGVSMETARRDLRIMEERQMIKKIYGGAIRYNFIGNGYSIYKDRSETDYDEKVAIARKCAEYVHNGETIFLGAGTTALEVAKQLKNKKDLSIVTFSLRNAVELIDTDFSIYFLGGKILNSEWHTITSIPESILKSFYCSKGIIGSLGISAKHGITDSPIEYSDIVYSILQRCERVYYVGANSKFGIVQPGAMCPLSQVDIIFTGSLYREAILKDFSEHTSKFVFVDNYGFRKTEED